VRLYRLKTSVGFTCEIKVTTDEHFGFCVCDQVKSAIASAISSGIASAISYGIASAISCSISGISPGTKFGTVLSGTRAIHMRHKVSWTRLSHGLPPRTSISVYGKPPRRTAFNTAMTGRQEDRFKTGSTGVTTSDLNDKLLAVDDGNGDDDDDDDGDDDGFFLPHHSARI
jgi:hypothetical protein